MQVSSIHFHARAGEKLADTRLQTNLRRLSQKFVTARATTMAEIDFEATRAHAIKIRDEVIRDLENWVLTFEANAKAKGAQVLYAVSPEEASRLVVEIAQHHGVKTVTKSKSMVSEEMALNAALRDAGIEPIETDLGEYILQINDNEPPSHIIAPVIHKDKEQVSELFSRVHHKPPLTEIPALTREARETLRPKFIHSDMGVTGGNFLIAETGSVALVTNEGNEGMCTVLPKVHVVVTGIEKIVPSLDDFATLARLLTRSATGQSISNYISLLTGTRAAGEADGPDHLYYVLVDGGRSSLLGGEFEEMLRCIRCGACMNHCPVYQKIGGHAYGWVYPGPMGSVLTPAYAGIEQSLDLPQAATMCGACHVVCPVGIPLPDLLRRLRMRQVERHLRPWKERWMLTAWAFVAVRPRLYALAVAVGSRVLRIWAGRKGRITSIPGVSGWTQFRDLPVPRGATFRERYASQSSNAAQSAVSPATTSPTSPGPR